MVIFRIYVYLQEGNFCWSISATFHLGPAKMIAMALHQFHRRTEMRRQMEIHRHMEMRQPKALRKTRRRTEKPRGPLLDWLAIGHGMLWILRRLIPFCILLVVFIPTTWIYLGVEMTDHCMHLSGRGGTQTSTTALSIRWVKIWMVT